MAISICIEMCLWSVPRKPHLRTAQPALNSPAPRLVLRAPPQQTVVKDFSRKREERLSHDRNRVDNLLERKLLTCDVRRLQHCARRRKAVAELQTQLQKVASRPLPRTRPDLIFTDPSTDIGVPRGLASP